MDPVSANERAPTVSEPGLERLRSGAAQLGLTLDAPQMDLLRWYLEALRAWNTRVNLVSANTLVEAETRHLLDSLTVTRALPGGPDNAADVLDLGSGAGLPGIPLKVVCPNTRMSLMDSVGKKTGFLRHICGLLGLHDVDVYTGRAEDLAWTGLRDAFDIVVTRGVAPLRVLVELTLPFCRRGGLSIAMKKASVHRELDQASRAITRMGGELGEPVLIDLEELGDRRALVPIRKVRATDNRYPRRPGVPAKAPL